MATKTVAATPKRKPKYRQSPLGLDREATRVLDILMAEKGWNPEDVARASRETGDPMRVVSTRTIQRIMQTKKRPRRATRNEIARALGVAPSMIWKPPPPEATPVHDALVAA